jgi:hypothetical protein
MVAASTITGVSIITVNNSTTRLSPDHQKYNMLDNLEGRIMNLNIEEKKDDEVVELSRPVQDVDIAISLISCHVRALNNLLYSTNITFSRSQSGVVCLCWTNTTRGPDYDVNMSVPLSFLIQCDISGDIPNCVELYFEEGFMLVLIFENSERFDAFHMALDNNVQENSSNPTDSKTILDFRVVVSREQALSIGFAAAASLTLVELDSRAWNVRVENLTVAFVKWVTFTSNANTDLMKRDKDRWCLHAKASEDLDLQAWYHHTFSDEIYGLKVFDCIYMNSFRGCDNIMNV